MTNHEDMEEQLIETVDEDGNVINFELIDIVQVEDDESIKDNEYALLLPVDENGEESDEEKEAVKAQISQITERLKIIRKEVRLCGGIEARRGVLKEKLSTIRADEEQQRKELMTDEHKRRRSRTNREDELGGI